MESQAIEDDVIDLINYLVFVYCKLKNCKVGEAFWAAFDAYMSQKERYEGARQLMTLDDLLAEVWFKASRLDFMRLRLRS